MNDLVYILENIQEIKDKKNKQNILDTDEVKTN